MCVSVCPSECLSTFFLLSVALAQSSFGAVAICFLIPVLWLTSCSITTCRDRSTGTSVTATSRADKRSCCIGGGRGQWLGGTMASAEHEPITGVWGQSPQRGSGAEPLVRGSGGEAPVKLKAFWSLDVQRSRQI